MSEREYMRNGRVVCQECGKDYKIINPKHLMKHDMSMVDYKLKYPDAPASSDVFKAEIRYSEHETLSSTEEGQKEINLRKNIREEAKKIEEKQGEVKKKEKEKNRLPPVLQSKIDVFDFLKQFFPNLIQNYFIEKLTLMGHLEYSYITDFVDPRSRMDFEFPSAFWHNDSGRIEPQRDDKLKADGWTVIRINSKCPTINELREFLDIVTE